MFRPLPLSLLSATLCIAQTVDPRLSQVFPTPALPYECVVDDIDEDGLPDIIFNQGAYSTGYGLLISNLGNRSFSPARITHHTVSGTDTEDTLVRLDGSGISFLFFHQRNSSVSPYRFIPCAVPVHGGGHFGKRIILGSTSTKPWVPLDLDGDGITEFIQEAPISVTGKDFLIHDRQPDGSYRPLQVTFSHVLELDDISLCDLDLDGDLDLSCQVGYDMVVFERIGPRSFASEGIFIEKQSYAFNPPVDLDGDGLPDFLISASKWIRNLGNLTFSTAQSATPGLAGSDPVRKITTTPGSPAILHVCRRISGNFRITEVRFGTGTTIRQHHLSTTPIEPIGDAMDFHALEDLDLDGFPDLLVSARHKGPHLEAERMLVAWGNATGFSPLSFLTPPPISNQIVATGDFDENGSLDVIAGPDVEGKFHFFANRGDGTFLPDRISEGIAADAQMPAGASVAGIKAANLDGDAHLDLAIDYAFLSAGAYSSARVIARGDGTGTFNRPPLSAADFTPSGNQPRLIDHIIDWDGDGLPDAITKGALQKNLGGVFSPTPVTLISPAPSSVYQANTEIGDLDGDGRPDIVNPVYKVSTVNFQTVGTMGIGYNNGQGGADTTVESPINTVARDLFNNIVGGEVKIADLNDDGLPDLVVNHFSRYDSLGNVIRNAWLRLNPAAGSRTPATWPEGGLGVFPSGPPLDFNGDGKKEFADLKYIITPAYPFPTLSSRSDLLGGVYLTIDNIRYPGDFDGDGDTDFLIPGNGINLTLVRNPTVEERSGITRSLIAAGVRPDKASPTADADGDGRDNRTELIFGTDPRTADKPSPNPLGLTLRANNGNPSVEYQLPSLPASMKVEHELEWSDDLIHWAPATGLQRDLISRSSGWDHIQATIPFPGEKGFYRIRGSHDLDAE